MGGEISLRDSNSVNKASNNNNALLMSVTKRSVRNSKSQALKLQSSGKKDTETPSKRSTIAHSPVVERRKSNRTMLMACNADTLYEKEIKALDFIQKGNNSLIDAPFIIKVLQRHSFMQLLDESIRTKLIKGMSLCKVANNVIVQTENTFGLYFYIILEGSFSASFNGRVVFEYKRGDTFGEYALMNNAPCRFTVISKEESIVWVLEKKEFKKAIEFITSQSFQENKLFLDSILLCIDDKFKTNLANSLIKQIYKPGDVIVKEGNIAHSMYIIKSGDVSCVKDGKVIRELTSTNQFGQRALMEGGRRTMDVVAKTQCELYSISEDFFITSLGKDYKELMRLNYIKEAFTKSKCFSWMSDKNIMKIFKLFTMKNYNKEEVIFSKGQSIANEFCIILEGSIYSKRTNICHAQRSDILYEDKLFNETSVLVTNDLVAQPDCLIALASYEEIKSTLGGSMKEISQKNAKLNAFQRILIFRQLNEAKYETLENNMKFETYENGKKIINQGDKGDKFYIVKSGRVDVFVNSKYVRTLNENEHFGARSLIISEKRSATAIANGTVELYSLTAKDFKNILEPSMIDYFKEKFYLEDNTIELRDLDNIKELGKGHFGSVNLVRSRKNKQFYAIKAVKKSQIEAEQLHDLIKLERDVLLKIDHPFIMKMVKYLKNENMIFFINEFIKGKELWQVIREIGYLNKYQAQFYGASLILAIDYLHSKGVIYRDLKPENCMVTESGYIKLIDFGTVKEIKERTSTLIGTPHYMAPEVMRGSSYGFPVDFWSIAICLYEFACAKVPFGEEFNDPIEIYKRVLNDELTFPSFIHDEDLKELLTQMLTKYPLNRLSTYKNIKASSWFSGFNWDKLLSLSLTPPYNIKLEDKMKDKVLTSVPYLNVLKQINASNNCNNNKKADGLSIPDSKQKEYDKWFKEF